MNRTLPILFSFFLLALLLPASSLQVKPVNKQAALAPCEQVVFPFTISGNGPVTLTLSKPAWLNASLPGSFTLSGNGGGQNTVNVMALYPCDASPQAGTYALTLTARQGSEATAGTVYVSASTASNLDVSLTGEELTCACGSGHYNLGLRNVGSKRESGTLLISTEFQASISGTSFDLLPGQSVSKQIVVDLSCSTPAGVYPLSVGVVSRGSGVQYAHAAVSVNQCYASNLTGPREVNACHGENVNLQYVVTNNGNFGQTYSFSSTLGGVVQSSAVVSQHSSTAFNVSIPSTSLPVPGNYNFIVTSATNLDRENIPVNLTTRICIGGQVPFVNVAYPEVQNNSFFITSGVNNLKLAVYNPNNFSLMRSALSLAGFGAVSDFFDLAANETKQVPITITIPPNFTNATSLLTLESDQGKNTRLVNLQRRSVLTGYFVLGAFVSDTNAAGLAVSLVILAALFYYAETQRRKQVLIDDHVSQDLAKILAKYQKPLTKV